MKNECRSDYRVKVNKFRFLLPLNMYANKKRKLTIYTVSTYETFCYSEKSILEYPLVVYK